MEPVKFDGANTTYVAEGCGDLPALASVTEAGSRVIVSCWRLNWRERLKVLWRGCVWLVIYGRVQPPVFMETDRPFHVCKAADADTGTAKDCCGRRKS